jgi:hypothetical protein
MMPEDSMRLFRDQMETWMNLMTPAAIQSPAEAQKAWEGFFRQQMDLWSGASEHARTQMEQMMHPFLQQMEATQAASQEMQRLARWFTDEAATTFTAMRDYYKLLADIEEQLAKLHRMAAEQIERMQAGLPRFTQGKDG